MKLLWIGVAGAAGSLARYGVQALIGGGTSATGAFPWGTFTVNVVGCFGAGLLVGASVTRFDLHPTAQAALTIGFLGAFTTFSTFAVETMRLAEGGSPLVAAANLLLTVGVTIVAVYCGAWLARTV